MNILICDDNPCVRDMIQRIFSQNYSGTPVFYVAGTFQEALMRADEATIDLAFLDIQLSDQPGDLDGMEVGRKLIKKYPDAEIVMVTSHQDYALIAFEIHPYAYVSKPIDINLFIEVIRGVLEKINRKNGETAVAKKRVLSAKLFICINKEMLWIPYEDILYIEKVGKELIIHTARASHTVRWTLSKVEEMLPQEFIRVHKSYIVNGNKIRKISEIGDRTYEITFQDSSKMALMSRYKATELFQALNISE